ncbi:MAG: hypothetical protein KJO65_09565 [Gemmatimonadetes bacterium]|nr:hypothetical protein [Gemmatimonadota bacterium]
MAVAGLGPIRRSLAMTEISVERIADIDMAELIESASHARRLDDGEERALVERWAAGQLDARDELVRASLRVAVDEAIRNRGLGTRQERLARVGARALVEAAETYDPTFHGSFSSWSRQVVRQAVRSALVS